MLRRQEQTQRARAKHFEALAADLLGTAVKLVVDVGSGGGAKSLSATADEAKAQIVCPSTQELR